MAESMPFPLAQVPEKPDTWPQLNTVCASARSQANMATKADIESRWGRLGRRFLAAHSQLPCNLQVAPGVKQTVPVSGRSFVRPKKLAVSTFELNVCLSDPGVQ
jgi:hypothetical protein